MLSRSAVMCIVLVTSLSAALLCLRMDSQSPFFERRFEPHLDDLNISVEKWLGTLPGVVDVHVQRAGTPMHWIIHLRDWHYIPKNSSRSTCVTRAIKRLPMKRSTAFTASFGMRSMPSKPSR